MILGLVWTLICHYQLRSTGKGIPVKTAMLMCIGGEIPDYKVTNFNKDWNDGRALCGVVDGIKPGLCPNHRQLDPKNGLNNCRLGMDLADMHFGVPQILAPEDLNNPAIDELSVMTYLSYFMSCISNQILLWVQQVLPERNITNLTHDWISGVNFAFLLERLFEICPECTTMDASAKVSNMEKVLSLIKDCLDCPLPHGANSKVLTDPEIDELSMCSILAQLRVARLKGGAGVFTLKLSMASGSLEVGEAVTPTVELAEELTPELMKQFAIFGQIGGKGERVTFKLVEQSETQLQYSAVPPRSGLFHVFAQYRGMNVQGSPVVVLVNPPIHERVSPVDLAAHPTVNIREQFSFRIKSEVPLKPDDFTLEAVGTAPDSDCTGEVVAVNDDTFEATFTPMKGGRYTVTVKLGEKSIRGVPFNVQAVYPAKLVSIGDMPKGAVIIMNEPFAFPITSQVEIDGSDLGVTVRSPKEEVTGEVSKNSEMSFTGRFTPLSAGVHSVEVCLGGTPVNGSPFEIDVTDPSLCSIVGEIPSVIHAGEPVSFTLQLGEGCSGSSLKVWEEPLGQTSVVTVDTKQNADGSYTITLTSTDVGSSLIHITLAGEAISQCPFKVHAVDINHVFIDDEELEFLSRGIVVDEPISFKINCQGAGDIKPEVYFTTPSGKEKYARLTEIKDGVYRVDAQDFNEEGYYKMHITYGKKSIRKSPWSLTVRPRHQVLEDDLASRCRAYGAVLEPGTVVMSGTPQEFYVDATEAGNGRLVVVIRGHKEDPKVFISDRKDGIYTVKFEVLGYGKYYANVWWGNKHIPGSPFPLNAHRYPNPGRVKVSGPGVQSTLSIKVAAEIFIDTTEAGVGTLSIRVRGIKDTFNVSAKPISDTDIRNLVATYSPTEPGHYDISIKLQGTHVTGSPFSVEVFDPDDDDEMVGDDDSDVEGYRYSSSGGEFDEEARERRASPRKSPTKSPRRVRTYPRTRSRRQVMDTDVFVGESATVSPGWTATPVSYQKTPMWHYPKTQSTPAIKKDPISDRHKLKLAAEVQEQKRQSLWTGKY